MLVKWLGLSSFKIKDKRAAILIDPLRSLNYGTTKPNFAPDVILLSSPFGLDYDNQIINQCGSVFKYPGEYESNDVTIRIYDSVGIKNERNNIFSISSGGIKLVHLGLLKQKKSIDKILEDINGADILLIPVGNQEVIGPSEAVEIVHKIEPGIVIPMAYNLGKGKNPLGLDKIDYFIQEIGQDKVEMNKLKIQKKDIDQEKTTLIVLSQ